MDTSSWSENEKDWFVEYWGAFLDPDEWESYGFSLSEANEWAEWDVEPGVASLYRKEGVLNPPDSRYAQFGCDIEEAIDWEREGFDLATAFEWSEWEVDPETAVKYRNQGILEPPSEYFRDEGISLEDAFNWVNIGLDDFDDASPWIAWGVSPQNAKKYLDDGIEPPDEEFRESGISLTEAIEWAKLGFRPSEWPERIAEDERYWKYWQDVGIKPEQANELREQLVEFLASKDPIELSVRDAAMYSYQSYYGSKKKTDLEVLTSECLASLTYLKELGMPISAENMFKWRGFTSEMILAAIDNSIEPDIAFSLGKNLSTPQGLELHSLLKSMGSEHHIDWVQRWGFTIADIQALNKLKIDLHQFVMIAIIERIDGRVLLDWAKAKWPITEEVVDLKAKTIDHVVSKWIKTGLRPKVAYPFFVDGFNPKDAKAWIESGVTDPKIAKRRQDAGLTPK